MEVLTQKFVKTKKPYICFGCGRTFPAGTRMEFSTTGVQKDNLLLVEVPDV